jgi:hypothetical protein
MELPLEARPPMPSPLGLCSNTLIISSTPLASQIQVKTVWSMAEA